MPAAAAAAAAAAAVVVVVVVAAAFAFDLGEKPWSASRHLDSDSDFGKALNLLGSSGFGQL